MEESFGRKWLVNHLQKLELSISYDEVTRYKQSAVESSTTESSNRDIEDKTFFQWVTDHVDHNQVTLAGKETFQGISVISASTFQMMCGSKCDIDHTVFFIYLI